MHVLITTKETRRKYTKIMAVIAETVTIILRMSFQDVPVATVLPDIMQETVGN